MECQEPTIELLLPDYYTGHLGADDEDRVREHLEVCRNCRHSLRAMAAISGKLAPVASEDDEGHFSPQLLGRYYCNPGSLDPALVDQIRRHLEHCSVCAADIKFLQDSDSDLRQLAGMAARRPWWSRLLSRIRSWS